MSSWEDWQAYEDQAVKKGMVMWGASIATMALLIAASEVHHEIQYLYAALLALVPPYIISVGWFYIRYFIWPPKVLRERSDCSGSSSGSN